MGEIIAQIFVIKSNTMGKERRLGQNYERDGGVLVSSRR